MPYDFTNDWFGGSVYGGTPVADLRAVWRELLAEHKPAKVLEVGSYEGRSACFFLQNAPGPLELHCIDTWQGSAEHDKGQMPQVEERFDRNTAAAILEAPHPVSVHKHKLTSAEGMIRLLAEGHALSFDLIYIDGCHDADAVLVDSTLAYLLLRPGGVIVWDDYLWEYGSDPLRRPKMAVDAVLGVLTKSLQPLAGYPDYQRYARKV